MLIEMVAVCTCIIVLSVCRHVWN